MFVARKQIDANFEFKNMTDDELKEALEFLARELGYELRPVKQITDGSSSKH
jgi:hypothetical protein